MGIALEKSQWLMNFPVGQIQMSAESPFFDGEIIRNPSFFSWVNLHLSGSNSQMPDGK